jgi:hypothetical protein
MTATATPGHTAGHMAFMLSSQVRQACIVSDMPYHPLLVVERPRVEFTYDRDPRQAMRTRVQMLEMCANDRGFGRESRCAAAPYSCSAAFCCAGGAAAALGAAAVRFTGGFDAFFLAVGFGVSLPPPKSNSDDSGALWLTLPL